MGVIRDRTRNSAPVFTLLDPFCGTGTVLLEALSLGCRVIGSDLDPKAIAETRENLAWWNRTHPDRAASPPLFIHDATRLHAIIRPASVDAIVTEPTLGPVRGITDNGLRISGIVAELRQLYVAAFREFARVLKPDGHVVFVVPIFRTTRGEQPVDITSDVAPLGFRALPPFPAPLAQQRTLAPIAHLDYARPDQRVGRRILRFTYEPT